MVSLCFSTFKIKPITKDQAVTQWIKQFYMNPNAVRPGTSFFSPLPPPFSVPSLPGQNPDKTPPVLAGKPSPRPRRLQPSSSSSLSSTSSCSSYRQRQSCLGSEKFICSTDELHRSARLSANMDVVVNGGGDLKCKDREGRCTSVCVWSVCV